MGCSRSRPSAGGMDLDFKLDQGGTALLIIDAQVDFHEGGSLAVAGANADAKRVAKMISEHAEDITQIAVTLDTHQKLHIANPLFWVGEHGEPPPPFTRITTKDLQKGVWRTSKPELQDYAIQYTSALEANDRFVLCVWPEHCLSGTPGHNVVPIIDKALQEWAGQRLDTITYVLKGTNPYTEMYSGLAADVPIAGDPSTELNTGLIKQLLMADRVVVCGQAMSHCVNFTMRDLLANWPANRVKDLVLLVDGASPVGSFEEEAEKFVADMRAAGCTVCTCAEAFN